MAIGFADKSSYAAQLDADPGLSSRLADCNDWKVALSSYDANKERFDSAPAESASNRSNQIRSIRFFDSLVPVPVSVLETYEVSSDVDFGRISLSAKDGTKVVVSAHRSRQKVDSIRTPDPLLARNPDAGPTIFQSMFRFDTEDLICKDTTEANLKSTWQRRTRLWNRILPTACSQSSFCVRTRRRNQVIRWVLSARLLKATRTRPA